MEPREGKMLGTQRPESISTKVKRIADVAQRSPGVRLTALNHYMDEGWMMEAWRRTRKSGAPGVDGQTAEAYGANLEGNLSSLLERAKSGRYRAPPVRRAYIPKGDGRQTRPIGIPTLEDKVLQRAVAMVLEPIYEQDFKASSHGFRPGRSVHGAIEEVWKALMSNGGGWVIEVDIKSFFDTMDKKLLQEIVNQRVGDGVIRRLIGKWLNAGVMEEGAVRHPEYGSPQGGVISPILSNIYLHEVVDRWFEEEVSPRLVGEGWMVRYADDLVIGLTTERDVERVMAVLPKRFAKYGLELHPEKTRVVDFRRPRSGDEGRNPGSFDFLGFTHVWGRSRKGRWVVKQKTAKGRVTRFLCSLRQWCRSNRHEALAEQHRMLTLKLRGHFNHYGITGNSQTLQKIAQEAKRIWKKWLGRRSQKARRSWDWFNALLKKYPLPRAIAARSKLRYTANPSH